MKITTDTQLVEHIQTVGIGKMSQIELTSLQHQSCVGVPAETAHNDTGKKGELATECIKKHLHQTYQCMGQTCQFLNDADADAATKNKNTSKWEMKIGYK